MTATRMAQTSNASNSSKTTGLSRPVPSNGNYINSGAGPSLQPIDIGHADYMALIDPDTAFWSLVLKDKLATALSGDGKLLTEYRTKASGFASEMEALRFTQLPSAVYFNPTGRCNLNCTYCYIPESTRRDGEHMTEATLLRSLAGLKDYFLETLPEGTLPQIVFHGAEPMLNRNAVFAGIEEYAEDFRFGIQTMSSFAAYAFFTLAFSGALLFLIYRWRGAGEELLANFQQIAARSVLWGFLFFSFSMFAGAIWGYLAWGAYWMWEPKIIWSFIVWFYYAGAMHAYYVREWRGVGLSIATVIGIFVVLFTYLGVCMMMKSSHSF